MADKQPNRLIIKGMIEAGGCTKETLKAELGISAASLATNFSYLRLMGFYPVAGDEGVLSFVDMDTWNEMQAQKSTKAASRSTASTKSPQDRYIALIKRVARCETAEANADKRAEEDADSEILDLRAQKANIETAIAKYELNALLEAYSDDIDPSIVEAAVSIPETDEAEEVTEPEACDSEACDSEACDSECGVREETDDLV